MTDPRTGSRWILGDKFDQVYPHLESIDALWYKKYVWLHIAKPPRSVMLTDVCFLTDGSSRAKEACILSTTANMKVSTHIGSDHLPTHMSAG